MAAQTAPPVASAHAAARPGSRTGILVAAVALVAVVAVVAFFMLSANPEKQRVEKAAEFLRATAEVTLGTGDPEVLDSFLAFAPEGALDESRIQTIKDAYQEEFASSSAERPKLEWTQAWEDDRLALTFVSSEEEDPTTLYLWASDDAGKGFVATGESPDAPDQFVEVRRESGTWRAVDLHAADGSAQEFWSKIGTF